MNMGSANIYGNVVSTGHHELVVNSFPFLSRYCRYSAWLEELYSRCGTAWHVG